MHQNTVKTYGVDFTVSRQGYVEVTRDGRTVQLGETRSRLFLAAVVLTTLIEEEEQDKGHRMAQVMDNLSDLVTGDLRGVAMKRCFDTLHVLKLEAGDTDVTAAEISQRLLLAH